MNPVTFTFRSLQRDIRSVVINPAALGQKIQDLTSQMLTEMSLEEITLLQHSAQSHTSTSSSLPEMKAIQTTLEIVKSVKEAKPEYNKLQKAEKLISASQLDEAVSLLEEIKNPSFQLSVKYMYEAIALQYRVQGETQKAANLESKFLKEKETKE